MYVVKYDLQSMVKLIKCIEQHPLLYDTNHHDYSIRSEQDRAWKIIAKEVEESESLCRDRWRSIRACFGRHLRNKNINRKPYYLAEYLDFLRPFTSAAKATSSRKIENGGAGGYGSFGDDLVPAAHLHENGDVEYYDYDEIFDELIIDISSDSPTIEIPLKRRRMSSSPMIDENSSGVDKKPTIFIKEEGGGIKEISSADMTSAAPHRKKAIDSTDPDIAFFKSLLSEVARMSPPKKIQFKQSVLSIISEILYTKEEIKSDTKEDPTEQAPEYIEAYTVEQDFHDSLEPSVLLTVESDDSEMDQENDAMFDLKEVNT